MFRKYKELFGNDDADDLCWFAPSTLMNPALPQHVVDEALGPTTPHVHAPSF